MTREEAIRSIAAHIHHHRIGECPHHSRLSEALHMAMYALRAQEDRGKGCEYCTEYKSIVEEQGCFISLDETKMKGVFLEACTWDIDLEAKVQFCPMCGRRLEEV